jgi:DNA modification methylase
VSYEVVHGDCIEEMAQMAAASVDAIVCDPPYGLGFMGKQWDDLPPGKEFAEQALRVLKPGGYLLAFGGTRTYHRLACAIEDAGFEIRDSLLWLYGSGFPKSLDVSKAIDKAAGAEREVVGSKLGKPGYSLAEDAGPGGVAMEGNVNGSLRNAEAECAITASATPEAAQWEGWGTALKPSHEPIVIARKPLIGTVAENVLEHGTGGMNVDGCRIGTDTSRADRYNGKPPGGALGYQGGADQDAEWDVPAGRWPANVVVSEEAASELDEQTGELHSQDPATRKSRSKVQGVTEMGTGSSVEYADRGGASRFFYCAKTSRGERNAGLEGFPDVEGGMRSETSNQHLTRRDGGDPGLVKNNHPTVKPINLMRWLCRLVTPPGGMILDPFLGSGTTGCAAALEGFDFIGIEREAEYIAIAGARIAFWAQHEGRETVDVLKAVKRQAAERKPEQPELEALAA